MNLKEATIVQVKYHSKSKDEITVREVLVVSKPQTTYRTIDLTGVEPVKKELFRSLLEEYTAFKKEQYSKIPNFEQWAEEKKHVKIAPTWRTLSPEGIKEVL